MKFSAVSIFCEDIREEKSGQDTIVGTLPDNLEIAFPPNQNIVSTKAALPKLGVYLRVNIGIENTVPAIIKAYVKNTNGELIVETDWSREVIDKAFADSKKKASPHVGFVFKAVMGPVPLHNSGRISVTASVDGVEYIAGTLNVVIPTVLEPPSSQSPPDAPASS